MKRINLFKIQLLLSLCLFLIIGAIGCREEPGVRSDKPYLVSTTTVVRGNKKTVKLSYDDAFRIIRRDTYNADSLYTREELTYDENGYQNGRTEKTAVIGYEEVSKWENNEKGLPKKGTKTVSQFGSELETTFEYTYDSGDRVLSYREFDEDGAVLTEQNYEYPDENGSKTVTSPTSVTEEILDESGNRLSYRVMTADGTVMSEYRYTYDEHGSVLTAEENGARTEYQNEYSDGRLVSAQIIKSGTLVGKTAYTYDETGALVHVATFDLSDIVTEETTYRYSYLPVE